MNSEKFIFAMVKRFNDAGELEAVASTGSLDRDSEIIKPEAWRASLPTYRSNAVILATHMHRLSTGDSPVIGSASFIDVQGSELVFRMKFAGTELGRQYEQLYREGHMKAFSVGFWPVNGEWQDLDRGKAGRKRVWVHTEVNLLEISAVPVPANPEALVRMRELEARAAGETLSGVKAELEAIVKAQLAAAGLGKDAIENLKSEIIKRLDEAVMEIRDQVSQALEIVELPSDSLGQANPPAKGAPAGGEKAGRADGGEGAGGIDRAAGRLLKVCGGLGTTKQGR